MSTGGDGPARALLVPEVLQASALDCGPAALASLLAGFGLGCPFEALRDACRTGRDGTSIDDLEAVAGEQGLVAEQILVPCDHLLLKAAACLPSILTVVQPGGAAHFVTLWRRHGGRVQMMDPAVGRRWPTAAALYREVYRHRAVVPAAAWRAWAASDEGLRPLAARLERVGVAAADRRALLRAATADPGWQALAGLDAGVRLTDRLVAAGGARRGREATRVLAALVDGARAPVAAMPAGCWTVRPAPPGAAGEERVVCEGAVLVRVRGLMARSEGTENRRPGHRGGRRPRSDDGGGATEPRIRSDAATLASLVLATAGAALGRLIEVAALVAALELLPGASSRGLRSCIVAALLSLAAVLLCFEILADQAGQALGRRRELVLRLRLACKLPRLPDRYLRTRLPADLAERAHLLSQCRRGPELAAGVLRAGLDAVLAAAGIAWLDPRLTAGAVAAAAGAVVIPVLLLPRFAERSGRLRAHAAALGGLYLDVLRGLCAIRAHGAEAAMRRRHDELLAGWLRARRAAAAAGAWFETAAQAVLSLAAAGLVLGHVRRHGLDPQALVLALWAFQLAAAGQRLAVLAGRELPLQRSVVRRIEEPLAATAECAVVTAGGERDGAAAEDERDTATADGCEGADDAATGVAQEGLGAAAGTRRAPAPAAIAGAEMACGGSRHALPPRRRRSQQDGVAIAFERVTIEIEGRRLLRDLDLAIPAGQHVAVLGSSGAGKSTLLGALLGWYRPASGRLLADGGLLDAAGIAALRRATAWAAPEVSLWRSSLLDNLCFGNADTGEGAGGSGSGAGAGTESSRRPGADGGAVAGGGPGAGLAPAEALRSSQLLDLVPQLPRGLQTPLGEAGGWLSGGEAQRLRFARALGRPGARLALLDEPFRGLGADQRRELLAAAHARWRGATLLCVTHSPAEAAGFDRVVVLDAGCLVEAGLPAALAGSRASRYRALLDAEARAGAALGGAGWRRLRLAAGRLREVPPVVSAMRSRRSGVGARGAVAPSESRKRCE